jgi:hypothetical protein
MLMLQCSDECALQKRGTKLPQIESEKFVFLQLPSYDRRISLLWL